MGEFWFVFKSLLITLTLIFVMQIKIGDQRIENHVEGAIHSSGIIGILQPSADGLALFTTRTFHEATHWINSKINSIKNKSEVQGGMREIFPEFKRSEAYQKQTTKDSHKE